MIATALRRRKALNLASFARDQILTPLRTQHQSLFGRLAGRR